MKKYIDLPKFIALCVGLLAAASRLWLLSAGVDDQGLYLAYHPGWVLYLLLTVLTVACCFYFRRHSPEERFCPPLFCTAVQALAGLSILCYCISLFDPENIFSCLIALVGIVAALSMQIPKGTKSLSPVLSCLFFSLEMLRQNMTFGGQPQFLCHGPQILAVIAAALACYQLWGKEVGLDNGPKRRFFTALAGFLCIAAAPGSHLMYACVGIWLLLGTEFSVQPAQDC